MWSKQRNIVYEFPTFDLSGQDVEAHYDKDSRIIARVRDWLNAGQDDVNPPPRANGIQADDQNSLIASPSLIETETLDGLCCARRDETRRGDDGRRRGAGEGSRRRARGRHAGAQDAERPAEAIDTSWSLAALAISAIISGVGP